jgi:hypothetical protein
LALSSIKLKCPLRTFTTQGISAVKRQSSRNWIYSEQMFQLIFSNPSASSAPPAAVALGFQDEKTTAVHREIPIAADEQNEFQKKTARNCPSGSKSWPPVID